MTVEDVNARVPLIDKFIDTIQRVPMTEEAAGYFKLNLFNVKPDVIAEAISAVIPITTLFSFF